MSTANLWYSGEDFSQILENGCGGIREAPVTCSRCGPPGWQPRPRRVVRGRAAIFAEVSGWQSLHVREARGIGLAGRDADNREWRCRHRPDQGVWQQERAGRDGDFQRLSMPRLQAAFSDHNAASERQLCDYREG